MSNNENQIESPKNEDRQERHAVITVNINKESAGSNKPMSSGAVPQAVISPQ